MNDRAVLYGIYHVNTTTGLNVFCTVCMNYVLCSENIVTAVLDLRHMMTPFVIVGFPGCQKESFKTIPFNCCMIIIIFMILLKLCYGTERRVPGGVIGLKRKGQELLIYVKMKCLTYPSFLSEKYIDSLESFCN